jgi:outer membrane murein-binding lipoprotein Lpp
METAMQRTNWNYLPLSLLILTPLALAGCASEGSVSKADTQASSAMAAADQSKAEADKAMTTAQQALKTAQAASTAAQQASEKADRMYQRDLHK